MVNIRCHDRGEANYGKKTLNFLDITRGGGNDWAVIELTGDTNPSHGQVRRFKGSRLVISSRWSGSIISTLGTSVGIGEVANYIVPKTLRETPESSSSSVIRRNRTSGVRSSKLWLLSMSRKLVEVHIVVVHGRQD